LLAPLLFFVRGTTLVEPLAIASSTLAVIAAMFFYVGLVRKYEPTPIVAYAAAIVTFLGTPAWHYARTLFSEPLLMLCAIGAYSFALRDKSLLVAGAFVGLGLLIKPPSALLMLPVLAMLLYERRLSDAVLFCAPVAAGLAAYLALNFLTFGSPFATAQGWLPGSTVTGIVGSLFSPQYGYLIVAPAIVAAFFGWPEFFCRYPRDAVVLGGGIMLHFLLYASYGSWSGSTCYAARYIVPLLPLIFVPLAILPQSRLWQTPCARYGLGALCALSIATNGVAAMAYWKYWDTNPVALAMRWIFRASVPG
jgi:hypothetical protein